MEFSIEKGNYVKDDVYSWHWINNFVNNRFLFVIEAGITRVKFTEFYNRFNNKYMHQIILQL